MKIEIDIRLEKGSLIVDGEVVCLPASPSYTESDMAKERRWRNVIGKLVLERVFPSSP